MATGDEIQGIATTEEADYKPLWGIEFIARFTHWLDEFTMANSAIIMMVAILAIGTDVAFGGHIFDGNKLMLFGIGTITVLGVETQSRTMLRRGKMAWDANKTGTAIWWWFITAPIIAMLFLTTWLWFLEHTQNISETQALAEIGISYWAFTLMRAGIFVFLFVLTGVNYYVRQRAKKRAHKDVKQEMLNEIDLAPVKAKLAQARALVDAANMQRVRGAGAALLRGDYGRLSEQDDVVAPAPSFAAVPASYVSVAPVAQHTAPPIQLTPYIPTMQNYNGNGGPRVGMGDDTLPPNGGGNGSKRGPGRPRKKVSEILADTPMPVERAPQSGILNAQQEQRAKAVEALQGWLLGMSQGIVRGEIVEEPTGVDAHDYLVTCGLAPKQANTSRKWLALAIQQLQSKGVVIQWSQPATATVG